MNGYRNSSKRTPHRRLLALLLLGAAVSAAGPGSASATARTAPEMVVARVVAPGAAQDAATAAMSKVQSPSHPLCHTGIPRALKDRRDVESGPLVHVVYLLAADAPDEALDTLGVLDCSVIAQNQWFEQQTDGLHWRFDTFRARVKNSATGKVVTAEVADVTFVRSTRPMIELSSGSVVQQELSAAGLDVPDKRYISFVAGGADGGPCGDAMMPLVSTTSEPVDGQYAQVYLFAPDGCRAHEFGTPGDGSFAEMIAQQEIIHNDGIVSAGAPHACALGVPPGVGHVCTGPLVATEGGMNLDPERVDVMYPFVSVPLSEKVIDPGRDDYFTPLLPTLRDLSDSPYLEQVDKS